MKGAPRRADLVAIFILMLAALACVAAPLPDPVKAVASFLLAFAIPGTALVLAIFPDAELPSGARFSLAVVFSFSTVALGGLIVQLFARIDTLSLALIVAVVTSAALLVAAHRRGGLPRRPPPRLARPSLLALLVLVAALVLAGVSIGIASQGQHDQFDGEHFSQLWMIPDGPTEENGEQPIAVGVGNHEGGEQSYSLQIRRGDEIVEREVITLPNHGHWEGELDVPSLPAAPLVATLALGGREYRQVALLLPINR